jgi:hypothetical protein
LWFWAARSLWSGRSLAAASQLILAVVVFSFIARALIVPALAETRSFREFMLDVNRLLGSEQPLYLYRSDLHSDHVAFYRGEPLLALDLKPETLADLIGAGNDYVIMTERRWRELAKLNPALGGPLMKSAGTGSEGDAPLVLARLRLPELIGDKAGERAAAEKRRAPRAVP